MGEPFGRNRLPSNDANAILASWFSGPEDVGGANHADLQSNLVQQAGMLSQMRNQYRAALDFAGPASNVPALPRMAQTAVETPARTDAAPAPAATEPVMLRAADNTTLKPDLSTTLTDFRLESTSQERAQTRLSAHDRIDQIRFSPDSKSYQWLSQNGLLGEFQNNLKSEQQTWLADGRFSVLLKTESGYGQTIVLNCDGTNSQRITSPDGRVLAQFTTTGRVIEPGKAQDKVFV